MPTTVQPTTVQRTTVLVLVVAGVALRFIAPSPMWLDEAISASLSEEASKGWSGLVEALRHDGHPPLYYVLLALWSGIVGSGDWALRAFSGVLGVVALPLAWMVGIRHIDRWGGLLFTGVVATSPFAIRYATEVRMYELLLVLLLLGHLAFVRAWERPRPGRLAAVSVVASALLLTHYWALFAIAVSLVALAVAAGPLGRRLGSDSRRAIRMMVALGVGCMAFVPWTPVFLDQLAHTGTPWASASRPTVVAALALEAFGGGRGSEALLVVVGLSVLITFGLGTRASHKGCRPEIGLAQETWLRVAMGLGVSTLVLGAAVNLAIGTTFQGRYAVFVLVPVLLAASVGLWRFPTPAGLVGLVLLALLSFVSVARELDRGRTQIGVVAEVILGEGSPDDLVVFCPDQLAPAGHRLLADRFTTLAYPSLDDGRRVDWRDYSDRNSKTDVADVADTVAALSGGAANVWLVWMDGYETMEGQCPALRLALADHLGRPSKMVYADSKQFDDAANLSRFNISP